MHIQGWEQREHTCTAEADTQSRQEAHTQADTGSFHIKYSGLAEKNKPKRDASACPKMAQTKLKEQKVIRSKLKRKKALRTKTTKSPSSGSDGDDLNLEYDPRRLC